MAKQWFPKKKQRSGKRKRFSEAQKRAYHIGFGVGLSGEYDTTMTRRYRDTLSPSEKSSFLDGYAKGDRNGALMAGMNPFARRKKKNGKS